MINLTKFINENAVEYSDNRVDANFIATVENEINVKIGEQLKEYILKYGYMAYEFIELYGITARQGINSDMVKKTIMTHKTFPSTIGFVALEDAGDGDFFIVDSKDNVYEFIPEINNEVKALNMKLFDYIYSRFESIKGK